MMNTAWDGKRVTILGGARQGLSAARWLVRHGARVTLNDRRPAEQMAAAQAVLQDVEVKWVLGSHPLEILDTTDILCLSGGIPLDNPIVVEAVRRDIPLTNDTQLFMEAVPCRTIGITGSAGKTTTTSLVGEMAKAALGDRAHVGGNIGDPLLNHVDQMQPGDLAILEISSFQLEQMTTSPQIAAVLNITPNHLDRHGTMEAYTAAKRRILEFQVPQDLAVLNREDPGSWALRTGVRSRLVSFGMNPITGGEDGSSLQDGLLYLHERGLDIALLEPGKILLRGQHNLMNTLAAFAIGLAAGLPLDAMLGAVQEFQGVPHRLEFVRTWKGASWYNDSIATAPERTMAAIRSFHEPIVLLLGGRDKNLPWTELADLVHQRVDHVVLFGEAAAKIETALGSSGQGDRPYTLDRCRNLEEAVRAAVRRVEPGDVVLLSPGGTSFDEFNDFEARGEVFRKWVSALS